jgi:galactoside O-acetyltransferase
MKRKIRSAIKKVLLKIVNSIAHLKIKFLEENINMGKNVTLGKNIVIKTTDGGSITIGDNVSIEANSYLYAQKGNIVIKNSVFIGNGTQIVAKESIEIGKHTLISAYSIIRDANHSIDKNKTISSQGHDVKEIIIGDDVWLGAHCVVTKGCHVEKGVVIGANAVVTRDVKAYTLVGGVPATYIKDRT